MSTGARLLCCVLGALAICPAPAGAQSGGTTADLRGVVRDQSDAVLQGATVTATSGATSLTRTSLTLADGRFQIPALPPGTYTVAAEAAGFSTKTFTEVTLTLGSAVELDFKLTVAGLQTTVDVSAAAAPLPEVRQTLVPTVVPQSLIQHLPTNGRNFLAFSVITPAVSVDRTPQQGASATSGLTFAGQRARSNNIVVDGLDNNDPSVGGVRATFSQEAVQEFQVLANSFSAEFGKASGGVVNIVTKSGGNQHAGTAFLFFRDETLNARDYFERFDPSGQPIDRAKAPYGQKQFGATLGGPVRRNRTFYFVSFEQLNVAANNFVTIDDSTVVTVLGRPFGTAADILRRAGFPVETGYVPYVNNSKQFLSKIDHRLRSSQDLTVRFNWGGMLNENVEPWGGQVARSRGALLDSDDAMLAASHVSVLSAKSVNELRGQVAYRNQAVLSLDPTCDGVCDQENEGGPTVEVAGVASAGRQRFTPQPRESLRYQVLDTFSWSNSLHGLKAGIDYNSVESVSASLPLHFGGRYVFSSLPAVPGLLPSPVSAVQALALGLPAAYVQGYGNSSASFRTQDVGLFVQDEYTPLPDLSFKLGVRYQKEFWPRTSYDVRLVGSYGFPSDSNDIAPRLAVTWNPTHDGKTSIHGAYGVFYDQQITTVFGAPQILTGRQDGVRSLVLRFPSSITAWNAPGRRLPEPQTPYPSVVYVPDSSLKTPYAHHVSFGVDRQLRGQASLSVNVIQVRGRNQIGTIDFNPVIPALGPGRRPEDLVNPVSGQALAGTSASVLQFTSFGETWYRGLTLSLRKRGPGEAQLLASYTFSKAEDNSTDFQSTFVPQNMGQGRDPGNPTGLPIGFNPNDERGPSVQDERHRLVVSAVYPIPGALQLSSILTIASGRPYNIVAGSDLDGNGDGGAFPADRARRVVGDPSTSVTRNAGVLPAQSTVDVRVSRRFRLGARASIEGIFEVFNLFNRTNFTEINNVFGAGAYPANPLPTFGQFQQAGQPRQAQLAARLTF